MRAASTGRAALLRLDPPTPPPWVADLLGPAARVGTEVEKEGLVVQSRRSGDLIFLRACLPRAGELDDLRFRLGVERCYVAICETLASSDLYPLRIWNYVPAIRRPSEDGFTRYEVFNAGRQQGYRRCYGPGDDGVRRVAASAVGHRGRDLVLHVLASGARAVPVENPRQRPAWLYSRRYGPEPPCFARASRLDGLGGARGLGLVAGTASIVGEDSRHCEDLPAQIAETFLNLTAVSAAVAGEPFHETAGEEIGEQARARYRELRIYVARDGDARAVAAAVRVAFPKLSRFDLAAADLCRPELLVEAEGVLRCNP
jgi:chorismate lyase/3-hydroxybenzoate synthase